MELISIVIPCYNESLCIKKNVQRLQSFLSSLNKEFEIILVNDGSTDNSEEVMSTIDRVNIVSYKINKGKGGAIKEGIKNAVGDYIIIMDADLSTDISAINDVLKYQSEYKLIIGSRHAKGSKIITKQPFIRRFIGWGCRTLVNLMFHLHLSDTQCGFKAIEKGLAKQIIGKQRINRFAFDVEYLYMAKNNGIKIKEIPVIWKNDRTSTVKASTPFSFFKELLRIYKHRKEYKF